SDDLTEMGLTDLQALRTDLREKVKQGVKPSSTTPAGSIIAEDQHAYYLKKSVTFGDQHGDIETPESGQTAVYLGDILDVKEANLKNFDSKIFPEKFSLWLDAVEKGESIFILGNHDIKVLFMFYLQSYASEFGVDAAKEAYVAWLSDGGKMVLDALGIPITYDSSKGVNGVDLNDLSRIQSHPLLLRFATLAQTKGKLYAIVNERLKMHTLPITDVDGNLVEVEDGFTGLDALDLLESRIRKGGTEAYDTIKRLFATSWTVQQNRIKTSIKYDTGPLWNKEEGVWKFSMDTIGTKTRKAEERINNLINQLDVQGQQRGTKIAGIDYGHISMGGETSENGRLINIDYADNADKKVKGHVLSTIEGSTVTVQYYDQKKGSVDVQNQLLNQGAQVIEKVIAPAQPAPQPETSPDQKALQDAIQKVQEAFTELRGKGITALPEVFSTRATDMAALIRTVSNRLIGAVKTHQKEQTLFDYISNSILSGSGLGAIFPAVNGLQPLQDVLTAINEATQKLKESASTPAPPAALDIKQLAENVTYELITQYNDGGFVRTGREGKIRQNLFDLTSLTQGVFEQYDGLMYEGFSAMTLIPLSYSDAMTKMKLDESEAKNLTAVVVRTSSFEYAGGRPLDTHFIFVMPNEDAQAFLEAVRMDPTLAFSLIREVNGGKALRDIKRNAMKIKSGKTLDILPNTIFNGVIANPLKIAYPDNYSPNPSDQEPPAPGAAAVEPGQKAPERGAAPVESTLPIAECVTGDTLLRRRRKSKVKSQKSKVSGGWEPDDFEDVRIDEIKPGDEIVSLDEATGRFAVARVNKLLKKGVQTVWELTTTSGKSIKTTSEHPYLVRQTKNVDSNFLYDLTFETVESYGRRFYFQLLAGRRIKTPAMKSWVEFSREGFEHIVHEKKSKLNVMSRIMALPKVEQAIRQAKTVTQRESLTANGEKTDYWAITEVVDGIKVRVVIRSINGGIKHFYSVVWLGADGGIHKKEGDAVSRLSHRRQGVDTLQRQALQRLYIMFIDEMSRYGVASPQIIGKFYDNTWTKIRFLKPKTEIATVDNDGKLAFEEIISIKKSSREQVYDIEVEGTHTFLGNGIVAHNTAIKQPAPDGAMAKPGNSVVDTAFLARITAIEPVIVQSPQEAKRQLFTLISEYNQTEEGKKGDPFVYDEDLSLTENYQVLRDEVGNIVEDKRLAAIPKQQPVAPVAPKKNDLIGSGPAQWFENLANATIYKWWPETRTRGTLPVLFDALRLRSGQELRNSLPARIRQLAENEGLSGSEKTQTTVDTTQLPAIVQEVWDAQAVSEITKPERIEDFIELVQKSEKYKALMAGRSPTEEEQTAIDATILGAVETLQKPQTNQSPWNKLMTSLVTSLRRKLPYYFIDQTRGLDTKTALIKTPRILARFIMEMVYYYPYKATIKSLQKTLQKKGIGEEYFSSMQDYCDFIVDDHASFRDGLSTARKLIFLVNMKGEYDSSFDFWDTNGTDLSHSQMLRVLDFIDTHVPTNSIRTIFFKEKYDFTKMIFYELSNSQINTIASLIELHPEIFSRAFQNVNGGGYSYIPAMKNIFNISWRDIANIPEYMSQFNSIIDRFEQQSIPHDLTAGLFDTTSPEYFSTINDNAQALGQVVRTLRFWQYRRVRILPPEYDFNQLLDELLLADKINPDGIKAMSTLLPKIEPIINKFIQQDPRYSYTYHSYREAALLYILLSEHPEHSIEQVRMLPDDRMQDILSVMDQMFGVYPQQRYILLNILVNADNYSAAKSAIQAIFVDNYDHNTSLYVESLRVQPDLARAFLHVTPEHVERLNAFIKEITIDSSRDVNKSVRFQNWNTYKNILELLFRSQNPSAVLDALVAYPSNMVHFGVARAMELESDSADSLTSFLPLLRVPDALAGLSREQQDAILGWMMVTNWEQETPEDALRLFHQYAASLQSLLSASPYDNISSILDRLFVNDGGGSVASRVRSERINFISQYILWNPLSDSLKKRLMQSLQPEDLQQLVSILGYYMSYTGHEIRLEDRNDILTADQVQASVEQYVASLLPHARKDALEYFTDYAKKNPENLLVLYANRRNIDRSAKKYAGLRRYMYQYDSIIQNLFMTWLTPQDILLEADYGVNRSTVDIAALERIVQTVSLNIDELVKLLHFVPLEQTVPILNQRIVELISADIVNDKTGEHGEILRIYGKDIIPYLSPAQQDFVRFYVENTNFQWKFRQDGGFAYYQQFLAGKTDNEKVALIIQDEILNGHILDLAYRFDTLSKEILALLPPEQKLYWDAYKNNDMWQWRLQDQEGYAYFKQSLAGKSPTEISATIIRDETEKGQANRIFNHFGIVSDDVLRLLPAEQIAFWTVFYHTAPALQWRLTQSDGYVYFQQSLADKTTANEMIATVIRDQTEKGTLPAIIHNFTTVSDEILALLPPDQKAFWTVYYHTAPTLYWRLQLDDGFTYFQQSLADKTTANDMVATVIQDETSQGQLSVIVNSKLTESISDDVLNLLPPDQKAFWKNIVDFLHAGVSEPDILKLTGQVEKNPAIRAAIQYIPPEQWVSFTKRYDLFTSLFDIDSQVASVRTLTGEHQQVQIAHLRKQIQEINQSYKTLVQKLSMGYKPVSDEDFFYLNYYLNSIDGNYAKSFVDIKKHFGIADTVSPQQALREISNALTTVSLKPMVLTFPFQMQDVYYSVPDDIAQTMRTRLAALPVVPAEQQQELIAQLEEQYAMLSDDSLTTLISENVASPMYKQIVDSIPQDGQEQFLKKFNGILGAKLPLEQKIPAFRAAIAAVMTVDDKQFAAVMQELFTLAGLNDLLPEFANNTLSKKTMSQFSQRLQELVRISLPEFIILHPGLADFQKTLESTDIWKQIKQANAKQYEADQTKQKYTKTISLVFSERTLLDVWQGLISGTCFGNYPYHLSKRENIVPVKMVKDGEVFGNALFLIQPGKMILIGFDPSKSFADVVSSDKMNVFFDRSMEAFAQIADANGWELMIGVSSEIGGYSNHTQVGTYIETRYLKGASQVPIIPEEILQPQYKYEPKNAFTLAPPILNELRSADLKPVLLESIVKGPVRNLADELNREAEQCDGQSMRVLSQIYAATGGKCTALGRLVKTLGGRAFTSILSQSWRTPIGELWRNFQSLRGRTGLQTDQQVQQQIQILHDAVVSTQQYQDLLGRMDFSSQVAPQAVQKIVEEEYQRLHPGLSPPEFDQVVFSSVVSKILESRNAQLPSESINQIQPVSTNWFKSQFDILRNRLSGLFRREQSILPPVLTKNADGVWTYSEDQLKTLQSPISDWLTEHDSLVESMASGK
ncbi:hypothetical protein KJ618_02105, partial [Patescibacteria group bacterium]|nr:hypothetical protein [Patescibacteria group bacterium]